MSTAQLKLRSDLVISRQEAAGKPSFVVKEPATGQFFRLREAEHYIVQQLDGSTSLDVIRKRVEEKFAAPLPPETLQQFIKSLRKFGLLETEESDSGHLSGRNRRVRGNLFYLRLKLFDPDRLFNFLIGKVRLFFTPYFFFLSAALIIFAFGITIINWDEISKELLRLYRFTTLPIALFTILVIATCHEFAHGLTCKRFGGEVHEVGFLLIYFCPAFYCNVSDAWLFPERSKRLWVAFAGPYFELFLWALSALAWRLTDLETGLHFVALLVMTLSGIRTLFNFTPLIKLDGYYLLSDFLEVPNLRRRSFRYVGAGMKKLWGSTSAEMKTTTPRERRIYLIYGLLAVAYTFWLLMFIGDKYGSMLIRNYGGGGLVLFALVVVAKIQSRFRRLFAEPPAWFNSVKEKLAPISRRAGKAAVLAVILVALFLGRMELKVAGEFRALPIHNADARTELDGIVEKIYVDEGNLVHQGDLIAKLVDRDYRADLSKTEADIDQKRAMLKMLKVGTRPEEIEVARTVVAKSAEQLKYVKSLLNMNRAAFEQQLIPLKELEQTEAQVAVQEKDVEEARNKLKVLLAGSRKEEIEATEAEIARLEAQRRYLEEQIKLLRVPSPITGVVTTPTLTLRAMIGQRVAKGDLIAKIYELKTITAQIVISEKEIGDVRVGQKVALKVRAYPRETFYGKVTSIATTVKSSGLDSGVTPAAASSMDETGVARAVLVTTQIDNRSLLLKPDMSGKAKIYCGEWRIFDLITRRLARYIRVELWSWW